MTRYTVRVPRMFGSQSLLRAAQIRNDERIRTNIQGQDTIAIEVR